MILAKEWLLLLGWWCIRSKAHCHMHVLTCHCHPLWRKLRVFLRICCNLLVGEELSFPSPKAFLSVGFLKIFILREVSFSVSRWLFLLLVLKASCNFFPSARHCPPIFISQWSVWPGIPLYPMVTAALLYEIVALHCISFPHTSLPHLSEGYVGLIWLQSPTLRCQVMYRCNWEDPVSYLQCLAFEETSCV